MSQPGYVLPIGGAEERTLDSPVLRRFFDICGGEGCRIAIIPTASQLPETGPAYQQLFTDMGADEPKSLPFATRADAEQNEEWIDVLRRAHGVFLTGGNQLRLSTILGGTMAARVLRDRQREGLHVAGTSAGAAILSAHMIAYGKEGSTPRGEAVALAPGIGVLDKVIVDQHFRQRDRLGRLLTAVAMNPRYLGLGVDENTAAVIDPHGVVEVVGEGSLTIVDGRDVTYTSAHEVVRNEPLTLLNVRLHVLGRGARYDLEARVAAFGSEHPPSN